MGIQIDGVYLAVFSVVELDECTSLDHPMTREECAKHHGEVDLYERTYSIQYPET